MNRARAFNVPGPVLWLGLALVAVHLARQLIGAESDEWILYAFAFIPARYGEFGEFLPGGKWARLWSPLSYAFLHADTVHLGVNVLWMASFGSPLARRFGAARFFALCLASAVAGAALHYLLHAGDQALMVGASGAVSGMMAAAVRFAFAPGGPLGARTTPRPALVPAEPLGAMLRNPRALAFIGVWFAINLVFGLAGGLLPGVPGPIAWEAHIGGFAAGLLLFPLLDPVPNRPADEGLA